MFTVEKKKNIQYAFLKQITNSSLYLLKKEIQNEKLKEIYQKDGLFYKK